MNNWNEESRAVSEFVDKFLDRALGASSDLRQKVATGSRLENRFYIGKLLPRQVSAGQSEYKMKVAPCSYIATFLISGHPHEIKLRISPSFNLYFRTAIRKSLLKEDDVDTGALSLYSGLADPLPPSQNGRDDMWIDWQNRISPIPETYFSELKSLEAPKGAKGRLWYKYDRNVAIQAFIRKRYCTHVEVNLSPSQNRMKVQLNLADFRAEYERLGDAPDWAGEVEVIAAPEESNTRITLYLTNNHFEIKQIKGDPNWYDTHLKVELLNKVKIEPVPCPVLIDKAPSVIAETRNCAFDELNSTERSLHFSPVARIRTTRSIAQESSFTFEESANSPGKLLETFLEQLQAGNVNDSIFQGYQNDVKLIQNDGGAIAAIGMIAQVYSRSIGPNFRWRIHQLAALIRSAAMYLAREAGNSEQVKPLVLNVPTAGGKTEAFFAAAMFCSFYELQHKRRAINIIKYPMKLLSSDQIARLARYSMIVDEIAEAPLGIGYMVGRKDQFDTPAKVIEKCPYPDPDKNGEACGAEWQPFELKGGVPTLQCNKGHRLHLGIDAGYMLQRQCPTFIVAIWDKFISQSAQRRMGLLFGANRYRCNVHGFLDFADTNQAYYQNKPLPREIECGAEKGCKGTVQKASATVPGVVVFDEGHLIRESDGTLDSHFETAYLQIAQELSGKRPIPIVSTATIAGVGDFLQQLGLVNSPEPQNYHLLPELEAQTLFFKKRGEELQHEALAIVPFDVMLTWAVPDLLDVFFETLASDYGYDAASSSPQPLPRISHLRQVMVYCSSYKNISALAEMNQNMVAANRQKRGRNVLETLQLSARYFDRVKAQAAIEQVRNVEQQIIYATNIASIGIDIDNLDVIFFFGLPSNVSEFIQTMNRTGRREGKPAICVAILGPNKERDMSYYRYWPQFVKGANQIVEPVPINRFASAAINRTFNNVTSALVLMNYTHKKQRKLYLAGELLRAIRRGELQVETIISELKKIYQAENDPAQEYSTKIEELWSGYLARLAQVGDQDFLADAFKPDWMWNLRSIKQPTTVKYPSVSDFIEQAKAGQLVTGDIDSEAVPDVPVEEDPE